MALPPDPVLPPSRVPIQEVDPTVFDTRFLRKIDNLGEVGTLLIHVYFTFVVLVPILKGQSGIGTYIFVLYFLKL